MPSDSPAVIIFDVNGNEVSVRDGYATDASAPGLLIAGTDGTDSHLVRVSPDGYIITNLSASQAPLQVIPIENVQKTLFDIGQTEIYIGKAAQGTDPTAGAWLIKKVTLDVNGNPVSSLYSSNTAVWNNRLSETYS